ncbi:hypothetical protein T484DRAFT_1884231 [Baffinella frigidus]|nr:hypothetical protein T484DRAFT_1884231 [Cryptophyta sp. CCMP2293]
MPPPRALACDLCGQMFFKASMPFHVKQCIVKSAAIQVPCPGCEIEYPRFELEAHMAKCRKAKSLGAAPRRGQPSHSGPGTLGQLFDRPVGGGKMGRSTEWDTSAGLGAVENGRMACAICGRKFNVDRIGTHTAICRRIESKGTARGVFDSTRQRMEGVVEQHLMPRAKSKAASALSRVSRPPIPRAAPAATRPPPLPFSGPGVGAKSRFGEGGAAGGGTRGGSGSYDFGEAGQGGARGGRGSTGGGEGRTYTRWREKRAALQTALKEARLMKSYKAQGRGAPTRHLRETGV